MIVQSVVKTRMEISTKKADGGRREMMKMRKKVQNHKRKMSIRMQAMLRNIADTYV